jgi:hypothetical protein
MVNIDFRMKKAQAQFKGWARSFNNRHLLRESSAARFLFDILYSRNRTDAA